MHKFLIGALFGSLALLSPASEPDKDLETLARDSLRANIVTLESGSYLRAGNRQFRGLWTRDFCFASRGLFSIDRADVVRDHLGRILSSLREEDGLVPRYLDNLTVMDRYLNLLIGKNPAVREPLRPNYSGGGGSKDQVIDSNSLVILTALEYVRRTGDENWWEAHRETLARIYRNHDQHLRSGLIEQGRAADWQDSVRREGRSFYTNLLYWAASDRLAGRPGSGIDRAAVDALRDRIISEFGDPGTGLYLSMAGHPQISLDGLLLAIDLGFHPPESTEARELYARLKEHPLWKGKGGVPGFATYPDYPEDWIEVMPRVTGMRHYHDRIYWSWLMALSAKIAFLMGDLDEGDRILARMEVLAQRDKGVTEVFWHETHLPKVKTFVYRAENPFSWGAGMVIDALETQRWARRPGP